MIRITIAGRVGRSELKDVNGTQLLSFSVAADVRSGREKETVWASCALWGKRADALAQYVTKGSQVTVTGAGRIRQYESKGEHRAELEIRVDDVALQGGGSSNDSADDFPF